MGQCWN